MGALTRIGIILNITYELRLLVRTVILLCEQRELVLCDTYSIKIYLQKHELPSL